MSLLLFLLFLITRRTVSVLSHTHTCSTRYTNRSSSILPHPPSSPLQPGESNSTAWATPLMKAAEGGYVEVVKALVAADPDPVHLEMKVRVPLDGVSVVCYTA